MIDQTLYECPANRNHRLIGQARYKKHLRKCKEYNLFTHKLSNTLSESLSQTSEDSTEDRKKLSELVLTRLKENNPPVKDHALTKSDANSPSIIKREAKRIAKSALRAEETQNKTNFKCMLQVHPFTAQQNSSSAFTQPFIQSSKISARSSKKSQEIELPLKKETKIQVSIQKSSTAKSTKVKTSSRKIGENSIKELEILMRKYLPESSQQSGKSTNEMAKSTEVTTQKQTQESLIIKSEPAGLKNSQQTILQTKEIYLEICSINQEEKHTHSDKSKCQPAQSVSSAAEIIKREKGCIICDGNQRKVILGCGHGEMCSECFEGLFHFEAEEMKCIECQKKK